MRGLTTKSKIFKQVVLYKPQLTSVRIEAYRGMEPLACLEQVQG